MTRLDWRWEMQVRTAGYLRRSHGRGPCQPKKKKKTTNKPPEAPKHDSWEFILLGGLAEDYRLEVSLSSAQRNCPTDVEEVSMHVFVVKGWRADQLTSWEKVAENQEEQVSLWKISEHFYPWEAVKIGFINFLWKLSNSLLTCCVSFPRARVPRSWSPSWTPIRACWRWGTAVGSDFILQNLILKDIFIVILKEKHQSSCGEKLLDAFSLFLSSQERSRG